MAKLIVARPGLPAREFEITENLTLGRASRNDVQVLDSSVSGEHCRIWRHGKAYFIEDLNSSNGTTVNGRRIDVHRLQHDDVISLGKDTSATFNHPAGAEPERPGPAAFEDARAVDIPQRRSKAAHATPLPGALLDDTSEFDLAGLLAAADAPPARPVREISELIETRAELGVAPPQRPNSKTFAAPREQPAPVRTAAPSRPMPAQESPNSAPKASSGVSPAVMAAGVLLVCLFGALLLSYKPQPPASNNLGTKEPVPPRQPVEGNPLPSPPQPTERAGDNIPSRPVPELAGDTPAFLRTNPPAQRELEPAAPESSLPPPAANGQELFKQACERRDQALAAENYRGARAALVEYCAQQPEGEWSERGRTELAQTEKIIDAALNRILEDARRAATIRDYHKATQRATRLLALDPAGKFGTEARALLNTLDEQTQPRFADYHARAMEQTKIGRLEKAAETLVGAGRELQGTRWAGQLSLLELKLLKAQSLLHTLEEERARRTAESGPIRLSLPSKKIEGVFSQVRGLNLELSMAGTRLEVPLRTIPPQEVTDLVQSFDLAGRHLELVCLWLLLDRTEQAHAEMEHVLRDPEQAGSAVILADAVGNLKNLRAYDFSSWQHQSDWEVIAGNWSTENGRFVLESSEGGNARLAAGAPFSARNARVSFDFELLHAGENHFFAFQFGEGERSVGLVFTQERVTLHGNAGAVASLEGPWTPAPARVDVNFDGDSVVVTINGEALPPLNVSGLPELSGTLQFLARQTACALDNIIFRNVEP